MTTKVPEVSLKPLPVRTYDMTDEENAAIAKAKLEKWNAGLKKEPEPKLVYTDEEKEWAMGMLTEPSQYDKRKPDDYKHTLQKKSRSAKTGSSSASMKRDVPQLGEQAKQKISPLKVAPSQVSTTQRWLKFSTECGLTLSQLDGKGPEVEGTAVAFNYVKGGPMVRP